MSAFSIGNKGPVLLAADEPVLSEIIGRVVRWIPGDVIVVYGAFLVATEPDSPSFTWMLVPWIATPVIVAIGALLAGRGLPVIRMILSVIAFGLWAIDLPNSGWQEIDLIADNRVGAVLIASLVAVIFAQIADRVEN